jgi:hypothetical protein
MNTRLEKKRLKLLQREERLKKINEENYNLELEIEQLKRETQILKERIEYLERR